MECGSKALALHDVEPYLSWHPELVPHSVDPLLGQSSPDRPPLGTVRRDTTKLLGLEALDPSFPEQSKRPDADP